MRIPLNETVYESKIVESDRAKLPEGVLCRVRHPVCRIGLKNANGRKYGKELWERVHSNPEIIEKLKNRCLFGMAEHPKETQGSLEKASHIVIESSIDEKDNTLYQTNDILDTPYGRIIDTLIRAQCKVGVSTRADGELSEKVDEDGSTYMEVIPESYRYVSTDYTCDPSTVGTFPVAVERNLMNTISHGLEAKEQKDRIDSTYAVNLLEHMNLDEAKKLMTNIKEGKKCGCAGEDHICCNHSECKCDKNKSLAELKCPECKYTMKGRSDIDVYCPVCRDAGRKNKMAITEVKEAMVGDMSAKSNTRTVIAKGIVDRTEADNLARSKNGTVVSDEEDPKKFMVISKDKANEGFRNDLTLKQHFTGKKETAAPDLTDEHDLEINAEYKTLSRKGVTGEEAVKRIASNTNIPEDDVRNVLKNSRVIEAAGITDLPIDANMEPEDEFSIPVSYSDIEDYIGQMSEGLQSKMRESIKGLGVEMSSSMSTEDAEMVMNTLSEMAINEGEDEPIKLGESKINELTGQGVELRLKHNSETGEWMVVYYENGKRNEEKTYYTDDRADAESTMKTIQSKIDSKAPGYTIESKVNEMDSPQIIDTAITFGVSMIKHDENWKADDIKTEMIKKFGITGEEADAAVNAAIQKSQLNPADFVEPKEANVEDIEKTVDVDSPEYELEVDQDEDAKGDKKEKGKEVKTKESKMNENNLMAFGDYYSKVGDKLGIEAGMDITSHPKSTEIHDHIEKCFNDKKSVDWCAEDVYDKWYDGVSESSDINAYYKKRGITPPKGKGIHTKKFHKIAANVAKSEKETGKPEEEAKRIGYATAMKNLGRDKAVHKSHWGKKNEGVDPRQFLSSELKDIGISEEDANLIAADYGSNTLDLAEYENLTDQQKELVMDKVFELEKINSKSNTDESKLNEAKYPLVYLELDKTGRPVRKSKNFNSVQARSDWMMKNNDNPNMFFELYTDEGGTQQDQGSLETDPKKAKKKVKESSDSDDGGDMTPEEIKEDTLRAVNWLKRNCQEWAARDVLKKFTDWGFWTDSGGEQFVSVNDVTARKIATKLYNFVKNEAGPKDIEDVYDIVEHWAHFDKSNESVVNETTLGELIHELPDLSSEDTELLTRYNEMLEANDSPDLVLPSFPKMMDELVKTPGAQKIQFSEADIEDGKFADRADVAGWYIEKIILPKAKAYFAEEKKNTSEKKSSSLSAEARSKVGARDLASSKLDDSESKMTEIERLMKARRGIFESFEELVDFLSDSIASKRLTDRERALIDTKLSGVTKDIKRVKLSEACIRAERDKAAQLLEEALIRLKQTEDRAKSIQEEADKKVVEMQDLQHKKEIASYIELKLSSTGLVLPENTRALLEQVKTKEEADNILEQIVDAMRDSVPHFGDLSNLNLVCEDKDPTMNCIKKSIAAAVDGMN